MNEKIVTSQAELDAIPVDYNGRIIIKFGTPNNKAVVGKKYLSPVEAWENSSVEAWENSSVVAWENSSVEAWENSSVVARGNSSVVARENSYVVAWENSSVVARGNSQIVDAERRGNIKISGCARIVYNPSTIEEWADSNGIKIENGKIRLYKAVHKLRNGLYVSDWSPDFVYKVGEIACSNGFTYSPEENCGCGIHMATASWACKYGRFWDDLALLELEADVEKIVVPLYEVGKVRAPKAKVLREVPLEEAGVIGKMLAKRKANNKISNWI